MVPGMTECCDGHDICYDTCLSDKKKCDKKFKDCLHDTCKKNKKRLTKKDYEGTNQFPPIHNNFLSKLLLFKLL